MITEPFSTSILAISYFGDVGFAISGALTAAALPHACAGLRPHRNDHRDRRWLLYRDRIPECKRNPKKAPTLTDRRAN